RGGIHRSDAAAGRSRSRRLVAPEEADQLSLNAHAIGRQDAHLISRVGWFERYRGAPPAKAFHPGLRGIEDRDYDVAGIPSFRLADQRNVAVENAGFNHAVATTLEGEVLAGGQQVRRHVDHMPASLDRFDGSAGGNTPHNRYSNRAPAIVLGR